MPYLCHHGVEGQVHGVRKYQNEDGTWTELGKELRRAAYAAAKGGVSEKEANSIKNYSNEILTGTSNIANDIFYKPPVKKKALKSMSDEDLRNQVNRLNLENQYLRLSGEQGQYYRSLGKRVVSNLPKAAGVTLSGALLAIKILRR